MKNKLLLATLSVAALCLLPCAAPSAHAVTDNEYIGHFGVTPVGQQAATVPTRTALQNFGYLATDGTITATASAGAATLSKTIGVITSESLTTAAGATYTLTLTNTAISASSVVLVNADANGSTGAPVITSVTPASGSVVIKVQNVHASAAFNGAIKIRFLVAN